MTEIAEVHQLDSLEDAIETLWTVVYERKYPNLTQAARALWGEFDFSHAELEALALEGFIQRAKLANTLHQHAGRPAIAYPIVKRDFVNALTYTYQAADGSQKALLDFNLTDLAYLAVHAGTYEQAWKRRREWASQTQEVMQEHGAVTVGKLPAHVLKSVAEAAAEAMGRQE